MMRAVFIRWDLPERIRADNGHPWGSASDLPRDLALWWIGLGIGLIWNHPRCPQQNGKVERDQGVTQGWVEAWNCQNPDQLRTQLAWAGRIQREEYPAIKGRPRIEAYPQLLARPRPYDRDREAILWDERRVYQYLTQGVWRRRADSVGQISIDNQGYIVGRKYRGQEIDVRLDPERLEWVSLDLRGTELRRFPAAQLTRERILTLTIGHRKPSRRKSEGVQPGDASGC